MANAGVKWKLSLAPGMDAAFKEWAKGQIVRQMRDRIALNRFEIGVKIMAYLKLVFWDTPVCKAMTGRDPLNDLPAEFGTSDHDMQLVAEHMAQVIGDSVLITGDDRPYTPSPGTVPVVEIRAVSRDWSEYELGTRTSYPSDPSGEQIEWMKWMLEDPAIDFITLYYDIVYKGEHIYYDTRIMKVSRSGRAVMASIEQFATYGLDKGGYVFPDICRQVAGKNFLEYTFSQPGVGEHVLNIVKGYLL